MWIFPFCVLQRGIILGVGRFARYRLKKKNAKPAVEAETSRLFVSYFFRLDKAPPEPKKHYTTVVKSVMCLCN